MNESYFEKLLYSSPTQKTLKTCLHLQTNINKYVDTFLDNHPRITNIVASTLAQVREFTTLHR